MTDPLEFFMPMKPPRVTAQMRGRTKSGQFYDRNGTDAARAKLAAHLAQHTPESPIDGPVRLVTKWCWTSSRKRPNGQWKVTRPDTDNLVKALKDQMTKLGYWHDDAQVASEVTEKFWADVPGIYVKVERLE
jgi:Holliday junction resolvase RusA-like endonuclease